MKKFIKKIILNKPLARLMIKPTLHLHSASYKWASRFAIVLNNGIHPKHRILRYNEWFLDNTEPGWTILDIGCNTGEMTFALAQKASFVYGIETNKDYLVVANGKNARSNIKYICADATTYNFNALKPLNCITLSNFLEHIENRIDFLKKSISNVKWADDNNRRVLIRVPLIDRGWIVSYKEELGLDYRLDSTHKTEYTLSQLSKELKQAGIKIEKSEVRFGEIYAVCRAV